MIFRYFAALVLKWRHYNVTINLAVTAYYNQYELRTNWVEWSRMTEITMEYWECTVYNAYAIQTASYVQFSKGGIRKFVLSIPEDMTSRVFKRNGSSGAGAMASMTYSLVKRHEKVFKYISYK